MKHTSTPSDLKDSYAKIASERKTAHDTIAEEDDQGVNMESLMSSDILKDIKLTGHEDDVSMRLLAASHLMKKTGHLTLKPLLPLD